MGKWTRRSTGKQKSPVAAVNTFPWGTVVGVVVIVGLAAALFGYIYASGADQRERNAALSPFEPSEDNRDPSVEISGVVVKESLKADHVDPTQRVAYEGNPPYGGPHDAVWAACDGVVYPVPIRSENAVHSLEHGAIWITYHPDKLTDADVEVLRDRVEGENYIFMSPVPTMDTPISLQSWGHQLKLDNANDERIDRFIRALRTNRFTHPEVGATCAPLGPGRFDPNNPPPFDPAPPGPDSVPMEGTK